VTPIEQHSVEITEVRNAHQAGCSQAWGIGNRKTHRLTANLDILDLVANELRWNIA